MGSLIFNVTNYFATLEAKTLSQQISFILWLFIILMPLSKIDTRDHICALVYTLFCVVSGVTLIWIIPEQQQLRDNTPLATIFAFMLLMAAVAAGRWAASTPKAILIKKEKKRGR